MALLCSPAGGTDRQQSPRGAAVAVVVSAAGGNPRRPRRAQQRFWFLEGIWTAEMGSTAAGNMEAVQIAFNRARAGNPVCGGLNS